MSHPEQQISKESRAEKLLNRLHILLTKHGKTLEDMNFDQELEWLGGQIAACQESNTPNCLKIDDYATEILERISSKLRSLILDRQRMQAESPMTSELAEQRFHELSDTRKEIRATLEAFGRTPSASS